MKYWEYKILTQPDGLDSLTEALTIAGCGEFIVYDPRDAETFAFDVNSDCVDPSAADIIGSEACISFYIKEGEAPLPEVAEIIKNYEVKRILTDDQDWLHKWEEYFIPQRIAKRTVVKPAWKDYEKVEGDIVIEIDPGMAFGTGSSPTTYMVVRLMEKYVQKGDDILDVGCGTGILSILAAKLEAGRITAIDLDPQAVESTIRNAKLNSCRDEIDILLGDLATGTDFKADVVVANLTVDLIVRLLDDISRHTKGRKLLIISGIIDDKEELAVNSVKAAGYEIIETLYDDCWIAMACRIKQ